MEKHKAVRSINRPPSHVVQVESKLDEADGDDRPMFGSIQDSCVLAKNRLNKNEVHMSGQLEAHLGRKVSPLDEAVLARVGFHNSDLYFEIMEAANDLVNEEISLPALNAAILARIGRHHSKFFFRVRDVIAGLPTSLTNPNHVIEASSSAEDTDGVSQAQESDDLAATNVSFPLSEAGASFDPKDFPLTRSEVFGLTSAVNHTCSSAKVQNSGTRLAGPEHLKAREDGGAVFHPCSGLLNVDDELEDKVFSSDETKKLELQYLLAKQEVSFGMVTEDLRQGSVSLVQTHCYEEEDELSGKHALGCAPKQANGRAHEAGGTFVNKNDQSSIVAADSQSNTRFLSEVATKQDACPHQTHVGTCRANVHNFSSLECVAGHVNGRQGTYIVAEKNLSTGLVAKKNIHIQNTSESKVIGAVKADLPCVGASHELSPSKFNFLEFSRGGLLVRPADKHGGPHPKAAHHVGHGCSLRPADMNKASFEVMQQSVAPDVCTAVTEQLLGVGPSTTSVAASSLGNNSSLVHCGADALVGSTFAATKGSGDGLFISKDAATVSACMQMDQDGQQGHVAAPSGQSTHLGVPFVADHVTLEKYNGLVLSCGAKHVDTSVHSTIFEVANSIKGSGDDFLVDPPIVIGSELCPNVGKPKTQALVVGPAADEVPLPSVSPHRPAQAIGSWADLVKPPGYRNGLKLEFVDLSACRKELKLIIPKAVTEIGCHEWENTLVGIFLDRKLPFSLVHRVTSGFWGNVGLTEILATDHGVFYFRFSSLTELEKVLEGGPWNVAGKPILLRKWEPQGSYRKDRISKVPVWVHLYNIPLEYWTSEGLSYIASMVGRPIHTDRMTASRKRITYARICVEVDASQEWIKSFEVEAESSPSSNPITIQVEYQWTPSRCSKCLCFGHDCSKQPIALHTTSRSDTRDTKHKWKLVQNAQKDSNTKAHSSSGKPVEGQWAEIPSKEGIKGKGKIDDNIKGPRCTVDEEGVKVTNCYMGDGPSSSAGTPPMEEDSIVSTIVPSFVPIEHSSGPRGKNVTAQVLPTNNRFHALPSAFEVGAAMEHTGAGQDTFTDTDCDEETEEYNDVVTCGPSTPVSPPSSRQRKKNAKMKHSGSRPKGRHRS